jgi:hypothetical protein
MSADELSILRNENQELKKKVQNLEHILNATGRKKGPGMTAYLLIALSIGLMFVVVIPMIAGALQSTFSNVAKNLE